MGLLDRFGSDPDEDEDDGPDFYRVVRKTPKGGWKAVDGFDEMAEPVDKDTFEYNASPLDPGEYRLFEVVDNLNRQPQSGVGWTLQIDGETKDREQDDEIGRLERKIDRLAESDTQDTPDDPQDAVERQKASLQLAALQSEDFLKRYGDQIILSMFDSDGGGGGSDSTQIGYDDWQENPIGASLFETMHMVKDEPEQVERLGEAIGRGVGSFVGSAADGYAGGDQSLADARAAAEEDAPEPEDSQETDTDTPARDLDAGPATIDDLGADTTPADTEDLAADIADARTTARRAGPGEQDRPADGPEPAADESTPEPTTANTGPVAEEETPEPAEPDHTDASAPDPDPMTASPDTDTTGDEPSDSDDAAAEIAGQL